MTLVRPPSAVTPKTIAAVRAMIEEDGRVTYEQIEENLGINSTSINNILRFHLHVRKLTAHWVLHELNEDQMRAHVEWCHLMLKKFENGESQRVWDIVTVDESWIYQYDPETERQSCVWVFPGEKPPVKFKQSRSIGMKMMARFFMRAGHIDTIVLQDRRTVTSDWYITICLAQVFPKVKEMQPKRNLHGLLLHHDNASAHTAAL